MPPSANRRILVVDDLESIRRDFARILGAPPGGHLAGLEDELFGPGGAVAPRATDARFELELASQGLAAVERVRARAAAAPFAVAFVDVRVPPGLDGIETVARLWEEDPRLEIVLCSAHSDHAWGDLLERLGRPGQFLVLGKPFDSTAVRQLALALTEKWSLARAAEEARAKLDALVQERTRALFLANARLRLELEERRALERRLLHAQKLEALGRLVKGVAHEINNPLSFLLADLDHVARELHALEAAFGAPARDLREAVEEAHLGGKGIHRIVQDLSAFSRPDRPGPGTVDVEEVMRFALRMARPSLPPEARLRTAFAAVPPLRASGGELSQVFLNLLVNAGRAVRGLPPDRQEIAVELDRDADGRVRAVVRDTGVGIPEAQLGSVFDPFFTTRPPGEGTGLGLAICHAIVERLGGDIRIASREGAGTTVTVHLPVEVEGAAAEDGVTPGARSP